MTRPNAQLERLEDRLLLSAMPTVSQLFAMATPVEVLPASTAAVSGLLADSTGMDVYQFTVPASGAMCIQLGADGSDLDSLLEIYSDRGRIVRRNDNANRLTHDSLTAIYARPGQVFFAVARSAKQTSGAYRLNVTSRPFDDFGNTLDAARTIRLNRAGAGALIGRINYASDADVFRFVATATGSMTVSMSPAGYDNQLSCAVAAYDDSGAVITQGDDSGSGQAVVTFDVTAGQAYYIAVCSGNDATGAYRLAMRTTTAPPAPAPTPDPTPQPDPAPQPTTPAPGTSVTAQLVSTAGGLQLLVLGTDGNDVITISQSASMVSVTTAAGTQSFDGARTIVVYGFGGNDRIRLTNFVTVAAAIDGGDGDDMIFDAGFAGSQLAGGAGDDLIVTIGGGLDTILGGAGLDSYWLDPADSIGDLASAEIAANTVHRVAQFYQPGGLSAVPMEIAGQNLPDPTGGNYWKNFANNSVFVDGPQYNDVAQGALGDCYFVAVLASLAQSDPMIVQQMIAPLGDGTFAVRFYDSSHQAVYVRVDGDLPTYSSGALLYAKLSKTGETWVALVEKAYAFFRLGQDSYASLSGGWMSDPVEQITNLSSTTRWVSKTATLYQYMADALSAGHSVTIGSDYDAGGSVVGSHAYMVKSVQTVNGVQYVTLYNPWGNDGRGNDGNPADGLITLTMTELRDNFSAAVFAAA